MTGEIFTITKCYKVFRENPKESRCGLLWNEYRFHSDAVVILVSGKSTGFLFLALRLRLLHRCIWPEFGV